MNRGDERQTADPCFRPNRELWLRSVWLFLLLPGVIGVIEAFSHSIYHIVREL